MLMRESELESKPMASPSPSGGEQAETGGPAESPAARSARLIAAAAELLAEGQILALQGVGGFQLLVDASNRAAVARLRRRKRRPARPFALLVADPAWLELHLQRNTATQDLLESPAAPIVLLPRRSWAGGAPASSFAHPGSRLLGAAVARHADGQLPDSPSALAHPEDSEHPMVQGPDVPRPDLHRPDVQRSDPYRPESKRPVSVQADGVHPPDIKPVAPHPAASHSADPNTLGLPQTERWPDPFPGVAPGNAQLGVMLPASPLHLLLVRRFGRPLVCTSGNRSGEPLCTDPADARERLAGIADAFLIHDRPIARPLDDSLAQLIDGRPALLRRARGYAPESLVLSGSPREASPAAVLALGGDHKAAPALALGGRVWLAPHLGDLTERRSFERFRGGIAEMRDRYGDQLERIAIDRHPGYLSHQIGVAMALPPLALQIVQHHAAHALAVVAEHGLEPPLLAFCADGLGYGEYPVADGRSFDGVHTGCFPAPGQLSAGFPARGLPSGGRSSQPNGPAAPPGPVATADGAGPPPSSLSPPLWGGELLAIGPDRIERLACLRPLPLPGGDRAAREPRRVALGLLAAAGPLALEHPGAARCRRAFRAAEWELLVAMVERGVNCPWSSSLGRLFDGVASLLGLCQRTSYEGEAGLRLQGLAALEAPPPMPHRPDPCAADPYPFPQVPAPAGDGSLLPLGWLDWQPLLEALLDDRAAGEAPSRCALRFHQAVAEGVADLISTAAHLRGCRTVVLAGGCFQNALLLEDLTARLRRRGLEPHTARAVPGNDGGLALGQVWACRRPAPSSPGRHQAPPPDPGPAGTA
jgi:hydrogenase maturation factor HypF (carbamoyltransferase family)